MTVSRRLLRPLRSLRLRVPATAMAVLAVSLAVAAVLAYELLLQDGRRDIEVVIAREEERFELSISELLAEAQQDDPTLAPADALRAAVRRYLQLNPSTDSYWTIVHFDDGRPLAAANGPPELEPLYRAGNLPIGPLNVRRDLDTEAGPIRSSSVPVLLGDGPAATLQIVSPLEPIRAEAREAALSVAAAAGVSLLLGSILLTASLWRSLAPLGALAATARSTELRSLSERVPVPETDDEVGILAREFNTMLDRLDRASAAQTEFMASIGHELRTPITIARGHIELLQSLDRNDPAALNETVAILTDELGRMGRLVEDLMAIARSEMDDFVRPRPIDLVQWFEELELKLSGLGYAPRVRVEPPPPITIQADPDRIAQAVLNLVNNARIHTPDGTRITVRARRESDACVLCVEDDGPGIPDTIRDAVFEPFVRSGDAPSSTGLGLSVVRAVTAAHGGEIVLVSGPEGTRIDLRIPWQPTDVDDGDLPPDDPVDLEVTQPSTPEVLVDTQPLTTSVRPGRSPRGDL